MPPDIIVLALVVGIVLGVAGAKSNDWINRRSAYRYAEELLRDLKVYIDYSGDSSAEYMTSLRGKLLEKGVKIVSSYDRCDLSLRIQARSETSARDSYPVFCLDIQVVDRDGSVLGERSINDEWNLANKRGLVGSTIREVLKVLERSPLAVVAEESS
jgi:hypothetical protein